MTRTRLVMLVASAIVLVVLGTVLSCVYTVYPTDQVLLTELGAPKAVITEPGLHFKVPYLQGAIFMPKALLDLEAPSEEVIALDKKRLVVDAFARWRIVDPLKFYQAVPYASQSAAEGLLQPILSSDIRRVLGAHDFAAVLSDRRAALMRDIRDNMNQGVRNFGIVVVDVRIRRADLPPANAKAIYARMQKEREREANEYRAEGGETAERIRARAEREVTVIKAEAVREASILKGEGDAEKTRILGEAYGQDPDFFAFYRSMQAYKDALSGDNTTIVLSPDNAFLKYFGQGPQGGKK